MLKILWAFLIALLLSFVINIGMFFLFSGSTPAQVPDALVNILQNVYFWLGVGIFSLAFFFLLTLPASLMSFPEN